MPAYILPNGLVAVRATVSTRAGAQTSFDLVADTGSTFTMISPQIVDKLRILDPSFQPQFGRQVQTGGPGIIVEIFQLTLTADVEDHGTGIVQTRTCSRCLYVHALTPPESYFDDTQGLLGMDSFDALAADPAKDQAGTRAHIGERY